MSADISLEQWKNWKEKYGEAFYLLNTDTFRRNYRELKKAFENIYSPFNIAYSYKTNYIPALCKVVNEENGYAEVVSEMERELALRIGVKPEKIIWNGPVKNETILREHILSGGIVNLDSVSEREFVKTVVSENPGTTFQIGVRCNFPVGDGVISRFGLDTKTKDFRDTIDWINETENVEFAELQCHFAKRDVKYWPARAKGMLETLSALPVCPKRVDLGGGLFGKMPAPLAEQLHTDSPTYEDYAKAVATQFRDTFGDKGPELLIEPGTAIAGDCMQFMAGVKAVKTVGDKTFVTILGSQKNINMTGVNPPLAIIPGGNKQIKVTNADIVGFTCIENDVLYHGYEGAIGIGDGVLISNCGSYSVVMKPPFILPNFPVLDISVTPEKVIKRAETFEDIFQTYDY